MRSERVYVVLVHTDPNTLKETTVWQGWTVSSSSGYNPEVPKNVIKHPDNEYKWRRLPISGPHAFNK